jgi:hypothetical protein
VTTVHDPYLFFAAIKTRLATLSLPVGESQAPGTTKPYLMIEPVVEDDDPEVKGTLGDRHASTVFSWRVRAVGITQEQVLLTQKRVRGVLLGWTPTVTGFKCGPVEKDGGFGVFRDDDVQPPLFDVVDEFVCFVG